MKGGQTEARDTVKNRKDGVRRPLIRFFLTK